VSSPMRASHLKFVTITACIWLVRSCNEPKHSQRQLVYHAFANTQKGTEVVTSVFGVRLSDQV